MKRRLDAGVWSVRICALLLVCALPVGAQQGGEGRRRDPRRDEANGMGAIGISLFAEPGFRGENGNFRADVSDLRKANLNDRALSLRVGRGEVWEVCEDRDFKGRCQVFSGDEADLGRVGWNARISSVRRLSDEERPRERRGRGGEREMPRIELFDGTNYRGDSIVVSGATPDLRARRDKAASVRVYGGEWELCDREDFRGPCVTIEDDVPDLKRVGLRDKVSSARPLGRAR